MGKYFGKHDLETGAELKIIREVKTSYGTLHFGELVTLLEVTHFPTTYSVKDRNGQTWMVRTFDVEEVPLD